MAVRRKADASVRLHATFVGLTTSSVQGKEVILNEPLASAVKRKIIKECLKGLFALPVATLGVLLMWQSSELRGFNYWLGTILGLVIMAVGMGVGLEFIKLLMRGELNEGVVAAMKGYVMKEWMRGFLAFLSIGASTCIFLTAQQIACYVPVGVPYLIGLILLAGGVTFFWTRSRLYKG